MLPRQHMLERRLEVPQIDMAIGEQQELRQRELSFTQDSEGARHRLASVALLHDRRGEGVITRLPARPETFDGGHDEREKRRQQLLQQVAYVEILLTRFADNGRRVDRVGPMRN